MTINDYITANGITARVRRIDSRPGTDWGPGARHFRVTLERNDITKWPGKRRIDVQFSQGSAHTVDPTAADVLDCLASDASGAEQSFEDWCSDYGYDTDSRKAEKTYKACVSIRERLMAFLGADFNDVVYEMERL